MKNRTAIQLSLLAVSGAFLLFAPVSRAQSKGAVVEEIVARVNNRIITLSDYQKGAQGLAQEVAQDCQNCSQLQIQSETKERQKNLLRDMIDQQLLIERAKDMDINVETDLVKRLDDVRKQNNLATMEELEKAVESQGIVWEDYKNQIRDGMMTQEVIRREVGGRMDIGSDEVKKYYEAHKQDFNRPEQVELAEIFLSTEGKSPEEMAAVRTRADDLRNRLVKGEDFSAIAKRYSEGSTADQSGDLGQFERGQLSKQLEDAVFGMEKGQLTDVIQTKTGFEILKVLDHFQAGLQPEDKVESEIMNILYKQKMDPAMRDYMAQLREESYVTVKPGYTDTAAVAGATVIQEVAPTPDSTDKKKGKKKLPVPKVNGS
ncbi:MAG TPA: peptidylprolyl isomerase [Candidatus Acidoferrales bacterium]|nr:peptidylprolyl isomerase [Candidatus Acidoferrales bacterium]